MRLAWWYILLETVWCIAKQAKNLHLMIKKDNLRLKYFIWNNFLKILDTNCLRVWHMRRHSRDKKNHLGLAFSATRGRLPAVPIKLVHITSLSLCTLQTLRRREFGPRWTYLAMPWPTSPDRWAEKRDLISFTIRCLRLGVSEGNLGDSILENKKMENSKYQRMMRFHSRSLLRKIISLLLLKTSMDSTRSSNVSVGNG